MISCDVEHQKKTESLIMPHSPGWEGCRGREGGREGERGRMDLITAAINRKEPRVALLSLSSSYQLPGRWNVTFSLRAAR